MPKSYIFLKSGSEYPCSLLTESTDEWGFRTVTLVDPPRRLLNNVESHEVSVEDRIDSRHVKPLQTPGQLLSCPPSDVSWQSMSRRSLARLYAYFLVAEDPQRRLDVRPVETLSHQVSLVAHILQNDHLDRLLIADEVGLGKTIEVGLLLKELLEQTPSLRVLYLAPARLVNNVMREFRRLQLGFRQWTSLDADARIDSDARIVASIHRAVHGQNHSRVLSSPPWDIIVVDECHHLTAWSPEAADPTQAYSLVRKLTERQPVPKRVVLMSGTPHQGHGVRFENLLLLLRRDNEELDQLGGRVIYRTKDDITDWDGHPLFPGRQVNLPLVIDLGSTHKKWLHSIHDFYKPPHDSQKSDSRRRAAGWRCAQAMQWATSSPQAGLGYLARQAVRAGWTLRNNALRTALEAMRPYRLGPADEHLEGLLERIQHDVNLQVQDANSEDIEEYDNSEVDWFDHAQLEALLEEGVRLVRTAGDDKWQKIYDDLLSTVGQEKIVLFAQPVETVIALSRFLEKKTGRYPALIIGGQDDSTRDKEVADFYMPDGPQFLVSSRAGGEGLNLQVARRLIHVDVPWNPMDMEQRVGRIHRFGSRETIIVDTVVVKDSREADAYDTARQKLKLIAETLVGKERFETVFSRVMALMPQDELQDILISDYSAPLSTADIHRLTEIVQRGFHDWKEFHDRYGEQQKAIQHQNPGLASWDDVAFFLEKFASARRSNGYTYLHFRRFDKSVISVEREAIVFTLRDQDDYVVPDYAEVRVCGPNDRQPRRLGLNAEPVLDALNKYAFPEDPVGAAYLRWPADFPLPAEIPQLPIGTLAFVRQTVQSGSRGDWLELGCTIHSYITQLEDIENLVEVYGQTKYQLLRGIFRATVSIRPEDMPDTVEQLRNAETILAEQLRKPSEDELARKIRHAVTPIFAGVLSAQK